MMKEKEFSRGPASYRQTSARNGMRKKRKRIQEAGIDEARGWKERRNQKRHREMG